MKLLLLLLSVIALALLLAAVSLRRRSAAEPALQLDLLPPEGAAADLGRWVLFFQSLYAIARPWWKRWLMGQPHLSFEFWSEAGSVRASCWLPSNLKVLVTTLLRSALPGIEITTARGGDIAPLPATRARLRLDREDLYPLGKPGSEALGAAVSTLAAIPQGCVQLVISPDVAWQSRACRQLDVLSGLRPAPLSAASILGGAIDFLFDLVLPAPSGLPKRERPSHSNPMPPADKATQPGYRTELRLRVAAATEPEAKSRMHALVAAYRGCDGANGLRPARVWSGSRFDRLLTTRRPPGGRGDILVPEELAGLFHIPAGGEGLVTAPVRLAPRLLPSDGKVLCLSEGEGSVPVPIAQQDCRQHIYIGGPTGSGKSTLMLNLILDDIEAGRGVGVLDPKGDLVRDLLERIPEREWERVILIDPSLREHPVGHNVLECDDEDLREVVADQVVTIFRKNFERFWGPRTDDILRAALLTLLRHPGSTLCEVPLLLLRPEAREEYTVDLDDPVGLEPFWEEYERMPEGTRLQMVGPVLNKLRSVLLRRTVRNMLGQATSTVNLAEAIKTRQIVLVSLAKGLLGEDTSRLLGSFFVARIWQAVMARAALPESARPDFNLYLDEFQNYLHLPQSLDEVLVEARGYHLGLVLANQHLGQLSSSTREALSANARTRVFFQCGQEDARYLEREFEPHLGARQLRNLQRFQVAVRLCVDGRTQAPFTGVTRPGPQSLGSDHAARLIAASLTRWGRPREMVEAEIERRLAAYRVSPGVRAK